MWAIIQCLVSLASLMWIEAAQLPSKCFECNFSPSGFVLGTSGWKNEGPDAGYHSCSFTKEGDAESIDQRSCRSGICFLRKDTNGLVYRGCADERLLPMGVSTDLHCKDQGATSSVWWFCEGDLCNGGPVGDNIHCPTSDEDEDQQETIYDLPPEEEGTGNDVIGEVEDTSGFKESDNEVQIDVRIEEDVNLPEITTVPDKTITEDPEQVDNILNENAPEGKEGYNGEDEEFQGQNKVNEVRIDVRDFKEGMSDAYYDLVERRSHLISGICDGRCYGNPSGLFPDPQFANYFVQCAMGYKDGVECSCCYAYTRQCPPGTDHFDDLTKVCI